MSTKKTMGGNLLRGVTLNPEPIPACVFEQDLLAFACTQNTIPFIGSARYDDHHSYVWLPPRSPNDSLEDIATALALFTENCEVEGYAYNRSTNNWHKVQSAYGKTTIQAEASEQFNPKEFLLSMRLGQQTEMSN